METIKSPRPTVSDVRVVESRGPWETKSGGHLDVRLALQMEELETAFSYDNPVFDEIKAESGYDIRGFRVYTVSDIPLGAEGANEWHKARTEMVTVTQGAIIWKCVDLMGNAREFEIDQNIVVITPPWLLHGYRSLADHTQILVMCNTLFIPEAPLTHDSFDPDSFYTLR